MTTMTMYEIESLWVKNALDVAFQPGNVVRVKSGNNLGVEGEVVALITLEPCPTYVIELPSGSSVVATEPDLEGVDLESKRTLVLLKTPVQ
jgi:hypothetical protein